MKKLTKAMSVFLVAVIMMSVFAIAPGAISSSSSAKEILNYYEKSIAATSKKEDVLKADNVFKYKTEADYSSLSGRDLEKTQQVNEELEIYDGVWKEEVASLYFYCDSYKEYYAEGKSQFAYIFSLKRQAADYDLTLKSAKCKVAKNGDATLTFVYLEDMGDGDKGTLTYTAVINKSGYIKSYSLKQIMEVTSYSYKGNPYETTETYDDSYTFVYNKVDVKSMELSQDSITLGLDEEFTIGVGDGFDVTVTVKPGNATYKDFYVIVEDLEVADSYTNENGEIVVYGVGFGETTLEVYAYNDELMATCDIVVEGTFFDLIIRFFRNLFQSIFGIFTV